MLQARRNEEFHTLRTGGTLVLFKQRVVALTYLSIPHLGELTSVSESISSELSFSLSLYVLGVILASLFQTTLLCVTKNYH